jgi:hypothetical protein
MRTTDLRAPGPMTRAQWLERVAFIERNSDADITLEIATGRLYAHHRHYELINGRLQVFLRFDEWPKP